MDGEDTMRFDMSSFLRFVERGESSMAAVFARLSSMVMFAGAVHRACEVAEAHAILKGEGRRYRSRSRDGTR
jgi:hypothetical protein